MHNDACEIGVDISKVETTQTSQFLSGYSLGIFKGEETICFKKTIFRLNMHSSRCKEVKSVNLDVLHNDTCVIGVDVG